jgi:hypothetical protein
MLEVEGKVTNGVAVPTTPGSLPEGATVRIVVEQNAVEPYRVGLREEDWPTTPEGIGEHLKRMQEFEPVELTPEDEARIAAWRAEMKRFNVEAVAKKMGLKQ